MARIKMARCRRCDNKRVVPPGFKQVVVMVPLKGSPNTRLRPKQMLVPVEEGPVETGGGESVS